MGDLFSGAFGGAGSGFSSGVSGDTSFGAWSNFSPETGISMTALAIIAAAIVAVIFFMGRK